MSLLAGKVALVTGAGSGIGAATARLMAAEGAAVAVSDIRLDAAEVVAADIRSRGGEARAYALDVESEDRVRTCVAAVREWRGPISVLHNNAAATGLSGGGDDSTVEAMTQELWDRTMAVNVRGAMFCCKHVLPAMVEAGTGSIVNTSSAAGSAAEHTRAAYGVSKAALDGLTRNVASHYGPHGIRCNGVAPSLTLTDTVAGPGRGLERMRMLFAKHTPSPLGTPEEVAQVVVFLASDRARYVNGVTMRVDGGMGAQQPYAAEFRRPSIRER
jgi:NAD(P)-dependent dehydrogenase (short-subunit alcohol dehydrogenase family)